MGWCRLSVRVLPPSDSVAVLLSSPRPADVADEPPASPLAPVRAPLATRREGGPAAQHHAPGIRNKQSTCTCAGGGRRTPATVRVVCAAEVVRLALLRVDRLRLLASNRRRQDARAQAGTTTVYIARYKLPGAHLLPRRDICVHRWRLRCRHLRTPSNPSSSKPSKRKKKKRGTSSRQTAGGGFRQFLPTRREPCL